MTNEEIIKYIQTRIKELNDDLKSIRYERENEDTDRYCDRLEAARAELEEILLSIKGENHDRR